MPVQMSMPLAPVAGGPAVDDPVTQDEPRPPATHDGNRWGFWQDKSRLGEPMLAASVTHLSGS